MVWSRLEAVYLTETWTIQEHLSMLRKYHISSNKGIITTYKHVLNELINYMTLSRFSYLQWMKWWVWWCHSKKSKKSETDDGNAVRNLC